MEKVPNIKSSSIKKTLKKDKISKVKIANGTKLIVSSLQKSISSPDKTKHGSINQQIGRKSENKIEISK